MMVVLIIIGIAAMIVVPSMSSAGTLSIQAASRAVVSDVVFAQNEAVARQAARRVTFDVANNSYAITDTDGVPIFTAWLNGDHVIDFNRDPRFMDVRLIAVNFGGQNYVEFDDLGAPLSSGTVDLKSEAVTYRVTVASFTGRVTVEPLEGG
jgi:Tfp pilus assembly protein FimT